MSGFFFTSSKTTNKDVCFLSGWILCSSPWKSVLASCGRLQQNNSGYKESDILAIDGIGSKYRCVFFDKDQNLIDLSDKLPIGWLWNHMSNLTGFGTLGASKLMGLVAYGKYSQYYYDVFQTILDEPITEKKQPKFKFIQMSVLAPHSSTYEHLLADVQAPLLGSPRNF